MPQIASSAIMAAQHAACNVVANFGDEAQAWVSLEISGGVRGRVGIPKADTRLRAHQRHDSIVVTDRHGPDMEHGAQTSIAQAALPSTELDIQIGHG